MKIVKVQANAIVANANVISSKKCAYVQLLQVIRKIYGIKENIQNIKNIYNFRLRKFYVNNVLRFIDKPSNNKTSVTAVSERRHLFNYSINWSKLYNCLYLLKCFIII